MKKKLLVVALGLSSSITLIGCGGSDDAATPAVVPVSYDVKVIDGYLQNAQVWLDVDGNKQLDLNEPMALSGAGGVAELDVTNIANPEQYSTYAKIIFGQTIDEDRGAVASDYIMSAPPGEAEITPLSTLVHILIEQNTDGTETPEALAMVKEAAIAKVANNFGIPEGDVLSDFIASNSVSTAYVAENIVISKILPDSENEFSVAVADGSDDATFNRQTAAVSGMIKQTMAEDTFDITTAVFNSEEDLTIDNDTDGVADAFDALPGDASEWLDTDKDGTGNNADTDDDGDGVEDSVDPDPLDPTVTEYADCDVSYTASASIADFNAQLASCDIIPEMDLEGNTITRIVQGSGQTRTYTFNIDNTADFYQNGVQYYRVWNLNADGNVELYYGDGQTLEYVIRLIDSVDEKSKYGVYANSSQSIYAWDGFVDIDLSVDILACEELDSGDAPLISRSYADFKTAVTACQNGKLFTDFSIDFINSGMILSTGHALTPADDVEKYQFNEGGTGTFTYNEGAGDISVVTAWTILEDGIIKVTLTYTDENNVSQTVNDYLAIVETNGIDYSVKVFSTITLNGVEDTTSGDLWSTVMSVPDTE
ncbi:MAG: hypothetical protein ACI935_000263 [Moritella dasanensis]|jgi:hypothetical protein